MQYLKPKEISRVIEFCWLKIFLVLFKITKEIQYMQNSFLKCAHSSAFCNFYDTFIVGRIGSDGSNTILSNIERTRTSYFEHQMNFNVFIYWWSNLNTLFLALDYRTSNFEPNRAFTAYRTESNISFSNIERTQTCSSFGNRTRTPYFWLRTIEHRTSNIVRPITNDLLIYL